VQKFKDTQDEVKWLKLVQLSVCCRRGRAMIHVVENVAITQSLKVIW